MWRFVQISDPHLGSYTDGVWNNRFLCTMMPDVMRCLRRDLAKVQPEFILATGDLASQPTRDATFAARDFMDWLGIPYYPMGGNHDLVVEDSRGWFREAYRAQLPGDSISYSFDHKNLHFCVLDPHWKWLDGSLHGYSENITSDVMHTDNGRPHWAVPEEQLAWLEEDLTQHRGTPTIVASHYPAIPIPERTRRAGMKESGGLDNGDELVALLRRYPNVKAFFSGHYHMNIIEEDKGFTHVITGALPEYPIEYREVLVYEDRLEISTLGLSDPSFAAESLIPGNGWTAGRSQDRTATIPLTIPT